MPANKSRFLILAFSPGDNIKDSDFLYRGICLVCHYEITVLITSEYLLGAHSSFRYPLVAQPILTVHVLHQPDSLHDKEG